MFKRVTTGYGDVNGEFFENYRFKIEAASSLKSSQVFTEMYDAKAMHFIINRIDEVRRSVGDAREDVHDSCDVLKYTQRSTLKGNTYQRTVMYRQTLEDGEVLSHRYNVESSLGCQAMMREIRGAVFCKRYFDLDMVNCHPALIMLLGRYTGVDVSMLKRYVDHRSELIAELKDLNEGASRGDIKSLFIRMIYGCGKESCSYFDKKHTRPVIHSEYSGSFRDEFYAQISIPMCNKFPKLFGMVKRHRMSIGKNYNHIGSCMSYLCGYFENQCLMEALSVIKKECPLSFKHNILCFDGVMVYHDRKSPVNRGALLAKLNQHMRSIGCDEISFEEKELDSSLLDRLGYDPSNEIEFVRDLSESDSDSEDESSPIVIDSVVAPSVLIGCMLQRINGRFRREYGSGVVYERVYSYYYKRRFQDVGRFINEIFTPSELMFLDTHLTREITSYICTKSHPNFEWMELDMSYIGFTNGVYNLVGGEFIPTKDVPSGIQVRVMKNVPCKPHDATPLFDGYIGYQLSNKKDMDTFKIMIGRSMYRITDNFDSIMLLKGMAGSGKSLTTDLIRATYSPDQVGTIDSNFEAKFGMSNLIDTSVVLTDDMPSNLARVLDRDNFLRMASGGAISAPIKNQKSAYTFEAFDQPVVMCGNVNPNYCDENGEIMRRLFIMSFNNIVDECDADTCLFDKMLKTELGAIVHSCRSLYIEFAKANAGKRLYDLVSDTFKDFSSEVREEVNVSYGFAMEKLVKDEGSHMTRRELNAAFREYMIERFGPHGAGKRRLNESELTRAGFTFNAINICRSCHNTHTAGCCASYDRLNRTCSRKYTNVALRSEVDTYREIMRR